jgi:hypothetical protein
VDLAERVVAGVVEEVLVEAAVARILVVGTYFKLIFVEYR